MVAGGFAGSVYAAVRGYFATATVAGIATGIAIGGIIGSGLGLAAISVVVLGAMIYDHYDNGSYINMQ